MLNLIRLLFLTLLLITTPLFAQKKKKKGDEEKKAAAPAKALHETTKDGKLTEYGALKFLERLMPEFKAATNDSAFVAKHSDEPFRYVNFTRGDHPENIEVHVFDKNPGDVVGPFPSDNYNYIFKIVSYSQNLPMYRASQIFIPIKSKSKEDSLAAYAKADEIINSLKKKKANWYQLYQAHSADFNDKIRKYHQAWQPRLDGDIGYFWEGHMIKEFNEAVKKAKKEDILTVRTKYGLHIVKVTEAPSQSYYKVKLIPLVKNHTQEENHVIIKDAKITKKSGEQEK